MTPERTKELLPIIQAFANGEEIECRVIYTDQWRPYGDPIWVDGFEYRIKPKTQTMEVWLNIYPDKVCAHKTKLSAEEAACKHCLACVPTTIQFTEGEGM